MILPRPGRQVPKDVFLGPVFVCQSDFWVPPMFALAAVILGAAYPFLDAKLGVEERWANPSVPAVLTSEKPPRRCCLLRCRIQRSERWMKLH